MNTTAKVILFPQPTKKGFPLKVRIIQNRKTTYKGLKFYLTESEKERFWNSQKMELRKSYKNYEKVMIQFNIELKKSGIKDIDKEPNQEPILFRSNSFSNYLQKYIENLRIKSQLGLLQKTNTLLYQLNLFCEETGRNKDILFYDLNIDFLNEFQNHLVKKNIKPVSQRGYFEKLRVIINKAIKENKYNPNRHPFIGFEFVKVITAPKCLQPQEFNLLKSLILEKTIIVDTINKTKLPPLSLINKRTGLKWLFQYYTYGMRVSDLLLLQWSNIYESGKRLKYTMYKTKNDMDIILNNELLDILFEFMNYKIRTDIIKKSSDIAGTFKYNIEGVVITINKKTEWYDLIRHNLFILSTTNETKSLRIFSKVDSELEVKEDIKEIYSKISTYTAVYNKQLKTLSNELEKYINKNLYLSSHMARHTFAYLSMLSDQSVYYISQALNHKSIKTTENYLKGFPVRHLDGKFYKVELSPSQKKAIDDKIGRASCRERV